MLIYDDVSKKSMVVVISPLPPPNQWLGGQNTSVVIGLMKLTEPSDALIYKSFLKHCILQTVLQVFLLFVFVWNKIFWS